MATDYTTIQKKVVDKFSLLNSIYFKVNTDNDHSFVTEGILGGSDGFETGADSIIITGTNSNINQLYNLNNTGTELPNFIKIKTSPSTPTAVYTYTPNIDGTATGTYTSVALSSVSSLTDLTTISEINCLSLLTIPTQGSEDTTSGKIYNFMQGLYTLYNLFEKNIWESQLDCIRQNKRCDIGFGIPYLKADGSVSIGTNDSTRIGSYIDHTNLTTYLNYVSPTLLDTILFSTTFNPFVARRLIYIWILLCNYLIATKYLNSISGTINNDTQYASNLVQKTYELIVQVNENVINNSNPITDSDINKNPNSAAEGTSDQEKEYQEAAIKKALLTWAITQINMVSTDVFSIITTKFSTFKGASNNYPTLRTKYDEIVKSKNNLNQYIYSKLLNIDASPVTAIENLKDSLVNSVTTQLDSIFATPSAGETAKTYTSITTDINTKNTAYTTAMNNAKPASEQQAVNVFGSINNAVGQYIDMYNTNQTDINYVSELLRTGKAELSTVKNLLNGRLATQKTQRMCEYIAIAILILFALFSFSIILMKVDKNLKLFGCIGLITFALIHFLGIQMLLNSSIFIIKTPSKPLIEKFATTLSSGNINKYLNYYNIQVMSEVSQYLDNTFTLVTLLESYKAYGNINLSMERELNYYDTIVSQLTNAQSKINNVYFSSYINTIDVSALLHLFQILTIIIAATTTLFVLVEDVQDNSIRNWIASIAGIFAVFSFVVYLVEVNTRVRTNPVKIYWGGIDATSLRD